MTDADVFYRDGLHFGCVECGACCRTHGDYAYVYLTDRDVDGACDTLKMSRIEFLNAHCRTDDNGHVHLSMLVDRCNFLDDNGRCGIYDRRPMQCRTWPFWSENLNERTWVEDVVPFCPGIGQGRFYSAAEIRRIARQRDRWYGIDF